MIGNQGICFCCGINQEQLSKFNPETINYLRKKCGKEIKQIWGSDYKYELSRVKQMGFKTTNEFKNAHAKANGFKNRWDMEKQPIIRKYGTIRAYFNEKARQNGFKDYQDYQNYLAIKKGFKNLNEYKNHLINLRDENNLCPRCGGNRDKERKKMCGKCLEYYQKRRVMQNDNRQS